MQGFIESSFALALSGGLLVAAIGYADDLWKINSRWRIIIHSIAALWAVYWLDGLPMLDLGTWQISLNHHGSLLALIGIIWLINLYNFMDGIDGLAASQGLFAAFAGAIALWMLHANNLAFLLLMLAASISGFTALNWPPAKIFMGDICSGYLGYIFAVFGLYTTNTELLPSVFNYFCHIYL
jgi:Fuc2NAc and GlcNAc transferase